MAANPIVAQAYADTYTLPQLQTIRGELLQVHAGAAEVSVSFTDGSRTVNREDAEALLETVMEALRLKNAAAGSTDPTLSNTPRGHTLNFSHRRIA